MIQRLTIIVSFICLNVTILQAQTQPVDSGSYIIDMGVTPQTVNNALKPYGLVYFLIKDHGVPVVWAINQSKTSRSATDFTHNSKNYKYGPFIIPRAYRTNAVDSLITKWKTDYSGLTVDLTVSDFSVSYHKILTFVPVWTLDDQNGSIAEGYLQNAGIPTSGYNWQDPQQLNCCYDLFVMPHADPQWSTHSNLYYWNRDTASGGCGGWIWAACHAVSALENMTNQNNSAGSGPYGDTMTNFLMERPGTNPAAIYWGSHGGGDGTYSNLSGLATRSELQYIDNLAPATENGSEQIYIPQKRWRGSTFVDYDDTNHPDLAGHPNAKAVKVAFGRGMGNPQRGKVLYEAGHSHNKSTGVANIAAQRVFFNFSIEAPEAKMPTITTSVPDLMVGGSTYQLNANAQGKTGPYSYYWTAACSGTFNNPFIKNPEFTPDSVAQTINCGLSVRVIDACGRTAFSSKSVVVTAEPQPPVAIKDSAYCYPWLTVTVEPLSNDVDPEGAALSFTSLSDKTTSKGVFTVNLNGSVTYDPFPSFTNGVDSLLYQVCDTGGLCDTTWIVIAVSFPDSDGDGVNDDVDVDDDNDGIADLEETGVSAIDPSDDEDGDGIPNYADATPGNVAISTADVNGDGILDIFDYDLDGVPDHLDVDSDNDGITDALEANRGIAPTNYVDSTGRISGSVGSNGMPDVAETTAGSGISNYPLPNSDGTGNKDFKDIDSDNDGITDAIEANGGVAPTNYSSTTGTIVTAVGSNGWPDSSDPSAGGTAPALTNSDADNFKDYIDIDADNDGIVDNIEGQTTSGYTAPSGTDADGDGWDDAYDPDNGGTPFTPNNHDGTDLPDYLDLDTDNDNVPDIREGHDNDSDGFGDWDSDDNDVLSASENGGTSATQDSDGDGLLNAWDPDSISCAYSAIQGQGVGATKNGGCASIQNTDGTGDRDWRDIDDDDDGVLTEDETADILEDIGIKDYLETPCSFGQIAEVVNDSITPTAISGYIKDTGESKGLTNNNDYAWMQIVDDDSLIYTFNELSAAGSVVKIDADWNSPAELKVYLSTDGTNYVLDGTIADPIGSGGQKLIVAHTTSSSFKYVKFKVSVQAWVGFDYIYVVGDYISCKAALLANKDSATTYANTSVEIDIQDNDTNNTSTDPLNVAILDSLLNNGSVVVNPDGTVEYSPRPNFVGVDSFYYSICSDGNVCDTALVVVLVQASPCGFGQNITVSPPDSRMAVSFISSSSSVIRTQGGADCLGPLDYTGNHSGTNFPKSITTDDENFIVDFSKIIPANATLKIYANGHSGNMTSYFSVFGSNFSSGPFVDGDTFNTTLRHALDSFEYTVGASGARYIRVYLLQNYANSVVSGFSAEQLGINGFYHYIGETFECENPPPVAVNDTTTTYFETPIILDISQNDADPNEDTLDFVTTPLTDVENGTIVISTDGTVSYTPDNNFTGLDSFQYIVCDSVPSPDKGCDTAWAFITVSHNPPVAVNDYDTTFAGVPTTLNLLTNDSEPDGQPLSLTIGGSSVFGGSIFVGGDGEITYTPPIGFTGKDSARYIICDGQNPNKCDTAYAVFQVLPFVNSAPNAVVDSSITELNESVDISTLVNDTDSDGHILINVSAGTDASNGLTGAGGTVSLYGNNLLTYTPPIGFVGLDSFLYVITDPFGGKDTAWNFVTVSTALNDPPVANNDLMLAYWNPAGSGSGVQTTIQPFKNDYDVDATLDSSTYNASTNPKGVEIITQPTQTAIDVTWDPVSGKFTYETDQSITDGTKDSFQYKVCDKGFPLPALCDTAWVYVTMYNDNDAPIANLDRDTTYVNQTIFVDVKSNDFDPENSPNLSYLIPLAGQPSNGTATFTPSGLLQYVPNNGFVGNEVFYYQMCDDGGSIQKCDTALVVIAVLNNDVIATPDAESTTINTPITIDIRANDLDPDGHVFWITDLAATSAFRSGDTSSASTKLGGSISMNFNGTPSDPSDDFVDYTPPLKVTGIDTFWYMACDVIPAPNTGCDMTYVVINISENTKPICVNDADSTPKNTPIDLDVLANDYDLTGTLLGSSVGIPVGGGPSNGSVSINNTTGVITYTPNTGFVGEDFFTYYACDNITPSQCDTAKVVVTVYEQFTIAVDDDNVTFEGVSVSGTVTTNDIDPEGDIQSFGSFLNQNGTGSVITSGSTIKGVTSAGGVVSNAGTLTFASDGSYSFAPASGFVGKVTIPYATCDDGYPIACDTADLVIHVKPMPDPSAVNNNGIYTNNDDAVSYGGGVISNVLTNDGDPDFDEINVSSFAYDNDGDGLPDVQGSFSSSTTLAGIDKNGNPVVTAGYLKLTEQGVYSFSPASGFEGDIIVHYIACDTQTVNQACDSAILNIRVYANNGSKNDPPLVGDDFATTHINKQVSGNWIGNDLEPNGDSILVENATSYLHVKNAVNNQPVLLSTLTTVEGGTVELFSDGNFLYTPPTNYSGPDEVTYSICDKASFLPMPLCHTGTIHLLVDGISRDYGDLNPNTFGAAWNVYTDADQNGIPEGVLPIWLGEFVSSDDSSRWNTSATGDSDDGLILPAILYTYKPNVYKVIVNSTVSSTTVYFKLWIDWNNDGVFDDVFSGNGVTGSPDTVDVPVSLPLNEDGEFGIRLRVALNPSDLVPTGETQNGETEDYFTNTTPLPVELIHFSAEKIGDMALLEWSTSSEQDNSHFVIERRNDDMNWQQIGSVVGKGNSIQIVDYNFIDEKPLEGINYYRLKQVDFNGTFDYSEVQVVVFGQVNNVVIYPNPANVDLNIVLSKQNRGYTEVELMDVNGKILDVMQREVRSQSDNHFQFDLSKLPTGYYFVRTKTLLESKTYKVIVN